MLCVCVVFVCRLIELGPQDGAKDALPSTPRDGLSLCYDPHGRLICVHCFQMLSRSSALCLCFYPEMGLACYRRVLGYPGPSECQELPLFLTSGERLIRQRATVCSATLVPQEQLAGVATSWWFSCVEFFLRRP